MIFMKINQKSISLDRQIRLDTSERAKPRGAREVQERAALALHHRRALPVVPVDELDELLRARADLRAKVRRTQLV